MIEYPPPYLSRAEIERVGPWIEAALEYDHCHDLNDVLMEVMTRYAQLWPFERSVVVTQLSTYPKAKVLTFWLAGGDMQDMMQHLPGIEAWGRSEGATRFAVLGRKGWLKVMAEHGYQPLHYVTYKDA